MMGWERAGGWLAAIGVAQAQRKSRPQSSTSGPRPVDTGAWTEELEKTWTFALQGVDDPTQSIRPDAVTTVRPDSQTQTKAATKTHGREESVHRVYQIGDFDEPLERPEMEIIGELGTGGMGSVFRARQNSLGRELAIKRLRTDIDIPDAREQFENEARINAVLDHQNIVPVHDMGVDQEGRVFYSMKLIEGTPWSEVLDARPIGSVGPASDGLDLRDHLEILIEVCNAVAFAHSRGILHRDIKPDNVMVGEYGEVLLVDWGLGAAISRESAPAGIADLDHVAVTAGTPTYMAPETARGDREQVGTWTDNYLLGAVLYELLYGHPPHGAATAIDAVRVAAQNAWQFPDDIPNELRPHHEVLKPILERALASDVKVRFADAKEFVSALREALRNLDSATLAASANEDLEEVRGKKSLSPHARYHTLARVIGTLEKALDSWPDNPDARRWLARAHLDHVGASLDAGDLILAGAHLDDLSRLPGTARLSSSIGKHVEKMRRQLAEAQANERARRVRGRVFTALAVIFLAGLIGLGATAYRLVSAAGEQATRERNHLSRLLIQTAADGIESELHGMFDPVRGGLNTAGRWARDGLIDSDDPAVLTPMFLPLLEGLPVVSLITRADSAGNEYMIMRTPDGWRVRITTPGEPTVWYRYLSTGTLVETYDEELDYNPLDRPWYKGARALREVGREGQIHWTPPYVFFTGKQPGITASVPVTSSTGREFVIGFDILLSEISEFTVKMPDARHGKVFVLTEDDLVIGLPRARQFNTPEARKDAVLTPLLELGDPVPAAALQAWDDEGRPLHMPMRFDAEGQSWWSGFRSFELTRRRFWIGVVLPESDFFVTGAAGALGGGE